MRGQANSEVFGRLGGDSSGFLPKTRTQTAFCMYNNLDD